MFLQSSAQRHCALCWTGHLDLPLDASNLRSRISLLQMLFKILAVVLVGGSAAFQAPFTAHHSSTDVARSASPLMGASIRELRDRVGSVKNTKKITSAMKLVAAAKVRRAQEAVLRSRPFSETLERILGGLLQRLKTEALDIPLLESRTAKKVGTPPFPFRTSGYRFHHAWSKCSKCFSGRWQRGVAAAWLFSRGLSFPLHARGHVSAAICARVRMLRLSAAVWQIAPHLWSSFVSSLCPLSPSPLLCQAS